MTIEEAAALLRNNGYMVFKVPDCQRVFDHGRHSLITKSVSCPGVNPTHGYHSCHDGTFGMWINCQCGNSYSDYTFDGGQTSWEQHKAEHGIDA